MNNKDIIKKIKEFIGESVYYDEYGGGYIWGRSEDKGFQMIAQVDEVEEGNSLVSIRGLGAIQNLKNLPCTPEEFQDHISRFIAEAINEKLTK